MSRLRLTTRTKGIYVVNIMCFEELYVNQFFCLIRKIRFHGGIINIKTFFLLYFYLHVEAYKASTTGRWFAIKGETAWEGNESPQNRALYSCQNPTHGGESPLGHLRLHPPAMRRRAVPREDPPGPPPYEDVWLPSPQPRKQAGQRVPQMWRDRGRPGGVRRNAQAASCLLERHDSFLRSL